MKILRLLFFTITGSAIVTLYVVTPIIVTFRPVLGGMLWPVAVAFALIAPCAVRIIAILRRTAPIITDSDDLLAIPLLTGSSASPFGRSPGRHRSNHRWSVVTPPEGAAWITEASEETPIYAS